MICFTECSDGTDAMRVDWTAILPYVRYDKSQITKEESVLEQRA